MRTIPLTVNAKGNISTGASILGRAGESTGASVVAVNVSAWTENAGSAYNVNGKNAAGVCWPLEVGLTATDGVITFDVPAAMLATAGYAEIEIVGDVKSASITLEVAASLTTGTAPEGADPAWIDRVALAAAGVAGSADALAAQVSTANQQLAAIVGGVALDVDETGDLIMSAPGGNVNLGRVMGPIGPKGETGATGAQGPAGGNITTAAQLPTSDASNVQAKLDAHATQLAENIQKLSNLAVNGTFVDLTGWTGNAAAADAVTNYHGAPNAIKFTSSKYMQQAVTIPIGHVFFMSAKVWIEAYGSGYVRIAVSKTVGGGMDYQVQGLDYGKIGAWQTVFGIFTNTDTDSTLAPFVQIYQGSGTTVAFTDIVVSDLTDLFGTDVPTAYQYNCMLSMSDRGYIAAGSHDELKSDIEKELRYPVVRYVSTTGSDLNDGKTASTPFLSFQAAINVGANKIYAVPGTYSRQKIVFDAASDSLEIKTLSTTYAKADIVRPQVILDNSIAVTPEYDAISGLYKATYAATASTNYYKVFVAQSLAVTRTGLRSTSYNAILWEITGDIADDVKLVPVLTLAGCQAAQGTFFYDGTNIYVNPTGGDITGKTYKRLAFEEGALVSVSNARKLHIEDLAVMYPAAQGLYLYRCNDVTARRVDSGYSAYSTGQELWQSNVNSYACRAYKNCADGFAPVNDGDCNYYDCQGYYNYDDGLSHHYNCTGCIVGGEYHHNVKGGVAPAHGAEVDVCNIVSHHNGYGAYVHADADTNVGKTVRHSGNVYYDNNKGISVLNYHVLSYGCKYTNNTTPTALAATNDDTSLTEL